MRFPPFFASGCLAAGLAMAAMIWPVAARAETLPGGVALDMTVPQLQQAQPGLKRVPRPARLAGGLVGNWSGSAVEVAGVSLTPTFFLADGQLRRVEYLAREGGPSVFAALLDWARARWGAELAANAPEGAYASWTNTDADAYLQLASAASGGQVRLVVKQRVAKDAGEL